MALGLVEYCGPFYFFSSGLQVEAHYMRIRYNLDPVLVNAEHNRTNNLRRCMGETIVVVMLLLPQGL